MQLVTNATLVRNRVRLAGGLHLAALAVFAVGLVVSLQAEYWFYSYLAILVGLILYQFAQANLRRWGPRFRQDSILYRHLKGLDNRFTLLAFPAAKLPDYLVVGPNGVSVLVARPHKGTITCRADRWSTGGGLLRLFRPLGNPTLDAASGVEAVKRHLGGELGDDPVEAVIVFTHPEVHLRIDGSRYPVTTAKELRHHLRRTKGTLAQTRVAELRRALEQAQR